MIVQRAKFSNKRTKLHNFNLKIEKANVTIEVIARKIFLHILYSKERESVQSKVSLSIQTK